ncbi:hypothetical protein V2H45_02370 [Tumidithrix elongata RA019]|uniref:Uncharacterized protein n=2 Tax=Tumidithrix TaxID=3088355 RepID=A0AAW9PWF4_9CYAN|nr:hypothetical protein [Tumidithrix elongata RA019]
MFYHNCVMFSHPVTEEEIVSEKNTDIVNQVTQQAKQTWTKISPSLQALLLKSTQWLIPALQSLNKKLTEVAPTQSSLSNEEGGAKKVPAQQDTKAKAIAILVSIGTQTLQFLIKALESLQHKLEATSASAQDGTAQDLTAPALPKAPLQPGDPLPLPDQVKQEVGTAWTFVQKQLVPVVLAFITKVVDKIDPPISAAWQKVTATPTVANTWTKVESSDPWKKVSTAIAPALRSMQSILGQIQLSDSVKHILEKRAAVTTLVLVFALLILLKPTRALSHAVKAPTQSPTQISRQTKQPIQKPFSDLVAPEKGDRAVSPNKVKVNDIQVQVTDASKKYGEGLIKSVQTNFKLGRLIVELTDAWYQLDPDRQSQLMSDLLSRSQSLKFQKLLVADSEMHLVARSPVAGTEMVIVRR